MKTQLLTGAAALVNERSKEFQQQDTSLRVRQSRLEQQEQRLTEAFAEGAISLATCNATVRQIREQLANGRHVLTLVRSNAAQEIEKLRRILELAGSLWICTPARPTKCRRNCCG